MKQRPTVTVIMPVYNVAPVLTVVLESVVKQQYPILEIILIDNHSSDASVAVAESFRRHHRKLPIRIIKRKRTYSLSASYNLGAQLAKGEYIVTIHSDGLLPTKYELGRLVAPLLTDRSVVASAPHLLHPRELWRTYPFWQQCLFARVVDRDVHSGNGKFDCYRKDVFKRIGGYDEVYFSNAVGSEDADFHIRLRKAGRVVVSAARVIHAHPPEPGYSLADWVRRRKFYAVTYGRHLRMHMAALGWKAAIFLIQPVLVISFFLSFFNLVFALPVLVFPFLSMREIYLDPNVRQNPRIFLLPVVSIFLIFYESLWMAWGFFSFRRVSVYNRRKDI